MKKRLLTTAWLMLLAPVFAITMMAQTVTVQVNSAGGLWDALEAQGISNFAAVKDLTVTGEFGESDFLLIKNQMSNLEKLDISATNVTEIPNKTFYAKEQLKTVRLPENITYFRSESFQYCGNLESITFGSQAVVTGKIVFPVSLRYVESNTFEGCRKLEKLDFSACSQLEEISSYALRDLRSLKELLLPSQGNLRFGWDCMSMDQEWDDATQQYVYRGALEELTLTKAVTWLESYCMPQTLRTLYVESSTPISCSEEAFNHIFDTDASNLKIYVPTGSKRNYAIANGWAKLYNYMQELGITMNISGFGTLQQGNHVYKNGSVFFNTESSAVTLKAIPDAGSELISVTLNGTAVSVAADGTFTIPTGTTVGTIDATFTTGLTVIDNPNGGELKEKIMATGNTLSTIRGLKVIGKVNKTDWAVISSLLKTLEVIDLSETDIQEVPSDAFRENSLLETCRLPENIKYIRSSAFYQSKALKTVSFGNLGNNIFPSSLIKIESSGFSQCPMLEDIDLSACTRLEGIENYGFDYCENMKNLILPKEGNFGIGWEAFRYSGLTTFTLTKAVNSISCYFLPDKLKTLYVESSTPLNTGGTCSFDNLDYGNCTLYVPMGSTNAYREVDGWSGFTNIQELGFKVNISGFGVLKLGNLTYADGSAFFTNQGTATTLKAVPDAGCQLISVTLNGTAVSVAADGTFAIPATTTIGTIDVKFTANQTVVDNTNGGELKAKLTAMGCNPSTIRGLKVVGKMAAKDWNFVMNSLPIIEIFDISETDEKSIPESAFQNKEMLTTVHLPSTVTTIERYAFQNCQKLTTVDGCEHVKEIRERAFQSCYKLVNFPFGNEIRSLESGVFESCTSLPESLVMPASLNSLGWDNVFNGSSIRSFDLSQCTVSGDFGYNTFGACTSLLLPEKGDYRLGYQALREAQLTELRLPVAVSGIYDDNVFPATLKHLYVSRTEPIGVGNSTFNSVDIDNCTLYIPMGSLDAYSDAKGWSVFTKIQEQGFKVNISGFGALKQGNLTFEDGSVFFNTQGSAATLQAVPDNGCELISVTLDGNAISVAADGTFTIPAGTNVGILDVEFTANMLTIDNPNGGELKDMIAAVGSNPRTIRALKVTGKMNNKDWNFVMNNLPVIEVFDISETDVKVIQESAFQNKEKLSTVRLPSTVTTISSWAFQNCPQLTTVDGCENVEEIGERSFQYCSKLDHFPFGNKLRSLGSAVFENCISLPETLVMPASLNYMWWDNIFNGSSIRSFDLSQCTLNHSLQYNTFGKCTSLLLPEKGDYQLNEHALEESLLKDLRLPAAVSSINYDHVLPSTLERLYVTRTEPITVSDNNAFANIDFDNCMLYVPMGSTNAYNEADGWSDFTKVKEYGMTVVVGEQGKVRSGGQTLVGTSTFFPKESMATFEIVPNAGWHTDVVTLDGVDIPFANNKFSLNEDQLNGKLTVAFAANQFNLQLQITGNGIVKLGSIECAANQTLIVDSLSTRNFTLEPATGQVVSAITFNGKESVVQNGGSSYVTPAITANSTLSIAFGTGGAEGDVVTYTVTTSENGIVEYMNTSLLPQTTIQVKKGVDAVFTIKPDNYYVIEKVQLDGNDVTDQVDANSQLTIKNVNAEATLEVTFVMNSHIIIALEDGMRLDNALTDAQKKTVTKLTVTGQLWDEDFTTMRDKMPQLTEIDLYGATNEWIPSQAFCITQSWDNSVGKNTLTKIRLPEVTRNIGWFAFAGCSSLKEVNFNELKNLESIDSYAFAWTSLNVIDLSNSKLTSIGDQFYKVKELETVRFPSTMTYLGNMFSESGLTEIDLSNCTNLKTLDYTFSNSKKLVKVTLPEGITAINYAFSGCEALTTINLPKSLQIIGNDAFYHTKLDVVDLSGNTEFISIGSSAFRECQNLKVVSLPASLQSLGSEAFSNSSVTTIDLSKTQIQNIPDRLFSYCSALESVKLPITVNNIGYGAFDNTKLQVLDLSGCTELVSIGGSAFQDCQSLKEVLLPASLQSLGYNAFSNSSITTIDMSKTQIQEIKESTFYNCRQLENVKMPSDLETIGSYAFYACDNLADMIELPSTIVSVGDWAFWETKIIVIRSNATTPPAITPYSMSEKWETAFVPEGCFEAYKDAPVWEDKKIIDKEVHAEVTVSKEGNLAIDINEQAHLMPGNVTHLIVHGPIGQQDFAIMRSNMTVLYDLDMSDAEVSVIPENAFLDKKVLMNVKLPASLLRIEQNAFRGCSSLKGSLVLPDGLKFIGWGAFQGCNSLDEVVLNENLEVIQGYAFEGCSSLAQEITLPRDFQSLGERAFANCTSLYGTVKLNRDFYMFMGSEEYGSSAGACFENCSNIETVDMSEPDFLDEIPYRTFAGCRSLKTVLLPPTTDRIDNEAFIDCTSLDGIEFPNTLRVINWCAFQNCSSLTSINLSDCKDLGTIESYAFHGCSSLETAYLPKSLNWIGAYAFADCRKLANLTVEALQPADLGEYVFRRVHTDRCVLSIPTGTFNDYLTAAQWGEFVSMRKNIDVTVGEGANLYFLNNETAMARGARRASAVGQQGAKVKDGSSLYVQENESAVFQVNPDENVQIEKVLFNGEDVTSQMVNGTYETPGVTDASSFEVQVKVVGDIHVKELRMLDDDVAVKTGENRQLRFAVYPTNATNKAIEWTSSDEAVAKINSDGIVTGVAPGRAEITGKTIDGGIEEKCQIVIMSNDYWIVMDDKVEDFIDNRVTLSLALHNEGEARDIQFDVYMPEGVNMDEWCDWNGNFGIGLSGRADGHTVAAARMSDGAVRVIVYSQEGNQFQNSDGELLTLPFTTGQEVGSFDVAIKNIHISGPNNFDFAAPNHTIQFNLKDYPLGDSNGNGEITINDAVNTVDYILERYSDRFVKKAADVNKDDIISVSDVTGTVDIVLERPSLARAASKTNDAQGRLYMNDLSMTAGEQQTIGLQMENAADFIAFQCDIYLPAGMNVARDENDKLMVGLSNGVTSNHIISANLLDNGVLRLLVMSPENEDFSLLEDNVVNLTVMTDDTMTGDDVIGIRDIRLVRSADRSEYLAPDASANVRFGTPTFMEKLLASKGLKMRTEGHYLVVESSDDTVLQMVSAGGISRNLKIHAGENRIFIENAGVYIIGGKKLFIK